MYEICLNIVFTLSVVSIDYSVFIFSYRFGLAVLFLCRDRRVPVQLCAYCDNVCNVRKLLFVPSKHGHCSKVHLKVNSLWIPYIIFRNTDMDEAVTVAEDTRTLVSVTRQGDFVRSGPEVADEVTSNFIDQ